MSVSTPQRVVAMDPKAKPFPSWTEALTDAWHVPALAPQEKQQEGVDNPPENPQGIPTWQGANES